MANEKYIFVLVPGAWYGGWVWRDVAPLLRAQGHCVSSPTFTGLGERKHLANDAVNLSTHIEDVVNHIEMEDLRGLTLVGWSYGGMILQSVVARCGERIRSIIYLDAFVPENGKSVVDYVPEEIRDSLETARTENSPIQPLPPEYFEVSAPILLEFVSPRIAPQPWRTFFEKVQLASKSAPKPTSYIRCEKNGYTPFQEAAERIGQDPRVRVVYLPVNHLCMLTDPELTVKTLLESA
ncbi:alpha/beta fold hydrolase [Terriglobus saanensis]|uniref:Hydrolase or acyltransferase of alpha/beta superfamily n=1 Tax=Terriglobus saanensis (strain ATCC BAA-1853 / DSM 23119 / SP1PR4) TaxID=401053 RepID=E8UXQ6_TERSS|nr:alpha/beta hydrolase [Terriglobus saanensis]ADV83072.1 hydrolase or acyltransferase of alpha/beta superfamily [Terriglobus saanensis SP1PR4]